MLKLKTTLRRREDELFHYQFYQILMNQKRSRLFQIMTKEREIIRFQMYSQIFSLAQEYFQSFKQSQIKIKLCLT